MTTDLKPFDKIWRVANDRYVAARKKQKLASTKWEKAAYNREAKIYSWLCDEMKEAFKRQNGEP